MDKISFYRRIEKGTIQGACRYREYWYVYQNIDMGNVVLELGPGKSMLGMTLVEKGNTVYATEIDKDANEYQQRLANAVANYYPVLVTDEKLPFEDNTFDVVVAASSIEHFDPDNNGDVLAIAETHRVLKKDGIFIITIPVFKMYFHNRYAGHPIHPPEKVYDEEAYKKRFLHGFEEVDRMLWRWSEKEDKDFKPHPSWIQRKGIVSTEEVTNFDNANGLCAVLRVKK